MTKPILISTMLHCNHSKIQAEARIIGEDIISLHIDTPLHYPGASLFFHNTEANFIALTNIARELERLTVAEENEEEEKAS